MAEGCHDLANMTSRQQHLQCHQGLGLAMPPHPTPPCQFQSAPDHGHQGVCPAILIAFVLTISEQGIMKIIIFSNN